MVPIRREEWPLLDDVAGGDRAVDHVQDGVDGIDGASSSCSLDVR
jgi:hypothetical protein